MYMQIRLPLICFLMVVFCYWNYMRKKRLPTKVAKVFAFLMLLAIFHLAGSTITEYTVNNRDKVPEAFNYVWHVLYLTSLTGCCSLIIYYILLMIERETGKQQKYDKIVVGVLCATGIAAQVFLPIEYIDTPNGSYSLGMKAYSLYLVVVYMLVMLVFKSLRYRTALGKEKSGALIMSTALFSVTCIIQIYQPYILLTGPALTMLIIGLIISTENTNLYVSYKTMLFNELGCQEMINEKLLLARPFKMCVYLFTGEADEIENTMVELERSIYRVDPKLMCGAMAENAFIVLPAFSWWGDESLPEELPRPNALGRGVKYQSEIISFDGSETEEKIRSLIRDRRIKYEGEHLRLDELTNLVRRETFVQLINGLLERNEAFSLLMIDVDDFKLINDTYGHNVGDIVLRSSADVLRSVVRSSDIVCRMGGDEFAIALTGLVNKEKISQIVRRIMNKLGQMSVLPDDAHKITITVGVRLYSPEDEPTSFEKIYSQADRAMYDVKKNGKNGLGFYEE